MHLLFTEACKVLYIHLILWWIPSAIQAVLLNKQHGDPNEFAGRIKHRIERIFPVMFEDRIRQQSIQKKWKEKKDVPIVPHDGACPSSSRGS
jgi:hypothetical protein